MALSLASPPLNPRLSTTSSRRYRADGELLDRILAAAAGTGRLGDPQRMVTAPNADAGVSVATGAGGRRQATSADGTATAEAQRIGAKTAEVTLTAISSRRYLADETEAHRICAAAEALGGLYERTRMLPDIRKDITDPADVVPSPAAEGIGLGL